MIFNSRISSDELFDEAQRCLKKMRSVRTLDSAQFLFSKLNTKWGPDHHQLNQKTISRSMASSASAQDATSDKDTETSLDMLMTFINNSAVNSAVFPVIMGRKDTIPGAIPLLDIIRAHISKPDTWKFPTIKVANMWAINRGISDHIGDNVDIREVVIGLTPNSDVIKIRQWAEDQFTQSENASPIGVLPCTIKYMPMTTHDVIRLGRPSLLGRTIPLQHSDDPPLEAEKHNFTDRNGSPIPNRWIKFPAKFVIGDGLNWLLIISTDITKGRSNYRCTIAPPQPALLELLHQLPPLTGPGIKFALVQFENILSQLAGFRIRLPNFIELPSLATLAGWNMQTTSFDALSLITLGTPQYSLFPTTSNRWSPRFSELPAQLKTLIIAEAKSAFMIYNCFLISLREEVLPDPEIWCFLTNSQQRSVLTWWADWVTATLRGITVSPEAATKASTRQQLLESLRAVDPSGQILDHPPYRIKLINIMIRGAATLTRGGCRFLHVERERALTNFAIAANEPIPASQHLFKNAITDAKIMYARFDQYNVHALDAKLPVPSSSANVALAHHPKLPYPKVEIDVTKISVDYMLDIFRKLRRSQTEGILEWARENPSKIDDLFKAFSKSDMIAKKFRAVYDPVRLIGLRVLNIHPQEVPFCEQNLTKHMNNAVAAQEKIISGFDQQISALDRQMSDLDQQILELKLQQEGIQESKQEAVQALDTLMGDVRKYKSIDRSKWRGPAQPPPREPRRPDQEPLTVHDRVGAKAPNPIEQHRRGVPPEERVRDHRFVVPEVMPSRGVAIAGETNRWVDGDEDPDSGRAAVTATKKRKADSELTKPRRSQSVPAVPR